MIDHIEYTVVMSKIKFPRKQLAARTHPLKIRTIQYSRRIWISSQPIRIVQIIV